MNAPSDAKQHDPAVIRALVERVRSGDVDVATLLATSLHERLEVQRRWAVSFLFDVLEKCYPDDPVCAGVHRRYHRDKLPEASTRLEAGSPSAEDRLALGAMEGDALRTLGLSAEAWLIAVGSIQRDV